MDDNKKFSIRQYRQALYADIVKRKKEQRKKWQAKYLNKLGVNANEKEVAYQENKQKVQQKKEVDQNQYRNIMNKT